MKRRCRLRDYHKAAEILWGEAGAWSVEEYQRLNELYFSGKLPPVPLVIGLTAYGRCLGLTRHQAIWGGLVPRITLQSSLFARGTANVSDTILHEMVHVRLMLAGLDHSHNGRPWCAEIVRLTPLVLGRVVKAAPIHPRRIDGKSVRLERDGF